MARNQKQNEQMRDDRCTAILSAAGRFFAVRGFQATKISDIAAEVGMSQGLLYHYYRSKEEIFIEIIRSAFDKMNAAARALEKASLSPSQKLKTLVSSLIKSLESPDFVWFSTLISTASISDAVPAGAKEIIEKERDVPYEVLARIVREGQAEGSVKSQNADDLTTVFWTAIKGLALHKAALGDRFKAPDSTVLRAIFFD